MQTSFIILIVEAIIVGAVVAGGTYWLMRPKLQAAFLAKREADSLAEALRVELEQTRKQALLEAQEEAMKLRLQAEEDARQLRQGLERHEAKLFAKDEQLETRRSQLEAREQWVAEQGHLANLKEAEVNRRMEQIEHELQHISGLDRETARETYLKRIEEEYREVGLRKAREIEQMTTAEAERKARRIVLDMMERTAVEYVAEATVAVVNLPNEEMKGRIIGREGRNIRAFEQVTGVDLIIDETPEAVVISSFDPIRRETARLALMNLMIDGRIHPGRIEELYEKAQDEIARMIVESGERAAERAGVTGLPHPVIETMGKLRFRTSYAQNVLDHSVEVAELCSVLCAELGLNVQVGRRAGFLHDIGKALGPEYEGPHAITGMEYLRQFGLRESILHAVGAHHHDIEPTTPEATALIIADSISAARPGARRESLDNYVKRLSTLEALANGFAGVERSYALQAGREVRVVVKPDQVDDLGADRLAAEIARRIEAELEYPGQIKVTVIRETRSQRIAK